MFVQRVDRWEAAFRAEAGAEAEARGKIEGQRQTIHLLLSHHFCDGVTSKTFPLLEKISNTIVLDRLALAAIRVPSGEMFMDEVRTLLTAPAPVLFT